MKSMKYFVLNLFIFFLNFQTAHAVVEEPRFLSLFKTIVDLYKDDVAKQGGQLEMIARYDVNMYVATARRIDDRWLLEIWGGYPRLPNFTEDGFQFLACHELGHHIGGEPLRHDESSYAWASLEGQADDFAARQCLYRLWNRNDISNQVLTVPIQITRSCELKWETKIRTELCERIIMAGYEFLSGSLEVAKEPAPKLESHDTSVVTENLKTHPNLQCRLDTIVNAALDKSRPKCWFAGLSPE